MFVDACAIIALISDEPEAFHISNALLSAQDLITSPIAVLEVALALARPDKFNLAIEILEPLIYEFLEERGIEICELPPPLETTRLTLLAAHRYRSGRSGLNLGDCLHYACAKYYGLAILTTDDAFRHTDLVVA